MKPIFQKLMAEPEEGFAFKVVQSAGFDCPWHFHPEYELILVLRSSGYRVVGDNVAPLSGPDMVLVGPGLPHIWQNENGRESVHALLIQFDERFLDGLIRVPALEPIRRLLKRSSRGLNVTGKTLDSAAGLMMEMPRLAGMNGIIQVLRILDLLAGSPECQPLASASFALDAQPYDAERMNRVFQFLNARLGQVIRLSQAARVVGLSEGAFSRFFRVHSGRSFPEFLNELRIGRACRLLIETDKNITEISYECGFTNLSNFNRQFLRRKKISPREFRRQMQASMTEAAERRTLDDHPLMVRSGGGSG